MPITEQKKAQFHPTKRNEVLAAADVKIQQVQLIDKKGQIRSVVLWRCGPDVFYASTMDGLFDVAQRKRAPEWLLSALKGLDPDRQFNYFGDAKNTEKAHLPVDDSDVPDFVQG